MSELLAPNKIKRKMRVYKYQRAGRLALSFAGKLREYYCLLNLSVGPFVRPSVDLEKGFHR